MGVPLIAGILNNSDCDELKHIILKKILNWHTKCLSYAGRVQLIIAVLLSIQTYWSIIFVLPKGVLKDIDAILRKFLHGGTEMGRSAKMAWVDVCLPKFESGWE